jgi:TPR repeat protein
VVRRKLSVLAQVAVVCAASAAGAPPALASQGPPVPVQPKDSRSGGATGEMSAETIFSRFASRILFLTCDESADESSRASGVLVTADGFIVTNAHVVEGCRSMTAALIRGNSRQSYVPVLKYYDEQSDVAVLKIVGHDFDFFTLPAHQAQIGERVYAIGNPRGLEQTITEGIVSGNRELDGTSWIQHSAPISPGSSGGALISSRGELLGINAFLLKESQNLNFAVPAATLATAISRARAITRSLSFPQSGDAEFSLALLYYKGQGVTQDYAEAARLLRQAADKGHAEAQATLGAAYEKGGWGLTQDYAQASTWFRKAADQGYAHAQSNLGVLYLNGQGVPQDYAQAAIWYRKAAEQGDAFGQDALGTLYESGTGLPKDLALALQWYRKAADQGYALAQLNLGLLYGYGKGVPHDYEQAAVWFRKAADQGDAEAQSNLGAAYGDGHGVPQSYEQAAEWYRKAAEQGDAYAQFGLGSLCEFGQGVPQDFAQAAVWYRKGAEQGLAPAQFSLGDLYNYGQGVTQDYAQAAAWFRKAAEQGDASSQFNLGNAYTLGHGVTQDYAEAATWLRRAAEQGFARAQYNLGVDYDTGQGVPRDLAQAAAWYRKAADQGNARAQLNLGVLYRDGQGVTQDYAQAYFWFSLAASGKLDALKLKEVTEARDMSATHLSPADLSQEQARASKWFAEHPAKP